MIGKLSTPSFWLAENRRALPSDIVPAIGGAGPDKASTKADGPVPNAKAPHGIGEEEAGD